MPSKIFLPTAKKILKPVFFYITFSMWAIFAWLGIIDFLEIMTTEWNFIFNSFSDSWKLFVLIIVLITISGFLLYRKKRVSHIFLVATIIVFCIGIFAHKFYTKHYNWLQTFPKFKSISSLSSIQAERIVITGKNFGEPDQRGRVRVGSLEFLVVSWNDETVVIEQPVPSRYYKDDMVLTNTYGNTLIIPGFSIKDPSGLWR